MLCRASQLDPSRKIPHRKETLAEPCEKGLGASTKHNPDRINCSGRSMAWYWAAAISYLRYVLQNRIAGDFSTTPLIHRNIGRFRVGHILGREIAREA